MTISKKRRNAILNAMTEAAWDLAKESIPGIEDTHPSELEKTEKEVFDLIMEVEYRAAKKVEALICSW